MKLSNWQWIIWAAFLTSLGMAPAAHADLLLNVQSVTAAPGDMTDSFNVYLTNTGTSPVDLAAFNFEISTTSNDITFQSATTATTLFPYIFAGNSLFGPTISTSSGQTLDASDLFATPMGFTMVNAGTSFGLGEISFNVAALAPSEIASVDFNTNAAFTNVSDQNGNALPLDFLNGQITIQSAATVPEPSTVVLLLTVLAGLAVMRRRFGLFRFRREPLD